MTFDSLSVKIYADGADLEQMIAMAREPWIRGFTTNPTLMAKAGVADYEAFARAVLAAIPDRPISFEVFSDEFQEMERQARLIAAWGSNVVVKIPVTNTRRESSAPLVHRLSQDGISVNVTAIMSLAQVEEVYASLRGGAPSNVSIFAGRIADTGRDPVPHMKAALEILSPEPQIELVWASPRELLNVVQASAIGCHIITVTPDILKRMMLIGRDLDEFSLDTVKMFHDDARRVAFRYEEPEDSESPPAIHWCPICRHDHFSFQFTQAGTAIVRCDGCGLLARRLPSDDAEVPAASAERAPVEDLRELARGDLDRIERYCGWKVEDRRGRRVFGLGNGCFELAAEAATRGYDPIPVSRAGMDRAWADPVDDPSWPPDGTVDVCVVGDVLGRTPDPMRLLSRIRRVLAPSGTIFVATPGYDRMPSRALRAERSEFRARDLFFFDRRTIEAALVRAGFEDVRIGRGRLTSDPASPIEVVARRAAREPIDARRGRVSVIMPVYNEKQTFALIADRLLQKEIAGLDLELVIVESRSTDGTADDVRRVEGHPRVKVVWQERPRGKGNAVRAGLAVATGDFVLIQDADLEYDIGDYEMLLEPLRTFRRAFVLGIRHGKDGHTWKVRHFTDQVLVGQWMNFGHLLFTALFNVVYQQRLSDPFTMYKVFRRECLSGLEFECNAFDFDWEIVGKLVRSGYDPLEIPVNYASRSFSEGKKVTMIRDPLTWIRACFKHRFTPLKRDTA